METSGNVVRIFISSTFKDMHSERDVLVREVFPRLREAFAPRGIHIVDIDLRWGVTEEEAERGKVLEICLDEIERSRPFFVGLLGERYGWVPPSPSKELPYDVPNEPRFDWLKNSEAGHSVTALEIIHGVLGNPEMKEKTFFYFRKPDFSSSVPESKRGEVLPESPEAALKLAKLKDRIFDLYADLPENLFRNYPCSFAGLKINWRENRDRLKKLLAAEDLAVIAGDAERGNPVAEKNLAKLSSKAFSSLAENSVVYLSGLDEFTDRVYRDLYRAIDEKFPAAAEEPDPFLEEEKRHRLFIAGRTGRFLGRDKELEELTDQATGDGGILVVTGRPGTGKSALLAKLTGLLEKDGRFVVAHFVGASPDSLELFKVLRRLTEAVNRKYDLKLTLAEAATEKEILEAFQESLRRASVHGGVIIILDGLDQMLPWGNPHNLAWLPAGLPLSCKVLIGIASGENEASIQRRSLPVYEVGGLTAGHRKELVTAYLAEYRKGLGYDKKNKANQMKKLLAKRDAELPLYLTAAAEELRLHPRFEEITDRIERFPEGTEELFQQILERLEDESGKALVREAFSLLACSEAGLYESELLDLLGSPGTPFPRKTWAKLYRGAAAYFQNAGEGRQGKITFHHRRFLEAVEKRFFPDEKTKKKVFSTLGKYAFGLYLARLSAPRGTEEGLLDGAVRYTGIYLLRAGLKDKVFDLIASLFSLPEDRFTIFRAVYDLTVERVITSSVPGKDKLFYPALRAVSDVMVETRKDRDNLRRLTEFLAEHAITANRKGREPWGEAFAAESIRTIEAALKLKQKKSSQTDTATLKLIKANLLIVLGQAAAVYEKDRQIAYFRQAHDEAMEVLGRIPKTAKDRLLLAADFTISFYLSIMGSGTEEEKGIRDQLIALIEGIPTNEGRRNDRVKIAGTILSLCSRPAMEGKEKEAEPLLAQALALAENLATEDPGDMYSVMLLSQVLSYFGILYTVSGNMEKSFSYHVKTLELAETLSARYPDNFSLKRLLASANRSLAYLLASAGGGERALPYAERALKVFDELAKIDDRRQDVINDLATSYRTISMVFRVAGDDTASVPVQEKAIAYFARSIEADPNNLPSHVNFAATLSALGDIHFKGLGNFATAKAVYARAKRAYEEATERFPDSSELEEGYAELKDCIEELKQAEGS